MRFSVFQALQTPLGSESETRVPGLRVGDVWCVQLGAAPNLPCVWAPPLGKRDADSCPHPQGPLGPPRAGEVCVLTEAALCHVMRPRGFVITRDFGLLSSLTGVADDQCAAGVGGGPGFVPESIPVPR